MENNTGFNNNQFDGFSEVMEMGLNSSAEILTKLLNNTVELNSKELKTEKIHGLESFGENPGIVVGLQLSGAIKGRAAVVVQNIYAKEILNSLMNVENGSSSEADEELDEISMGTFKELIGQMTAAFSDTVTSFLGEKFSAVTTGVQELSAECEEIAEVFGCNSDEIVYSSINSFLITDVLSGGFNICFDENTINNVINRILLPTSSDNFIDQNSVFSAATNGVHSANIVKDGSISVQDASFPTFAGNGINGIPLLQGNMDLLMDVPLNVTIEIGKTRRKMRDIMEFSQGTIIDLEKQAGAPVDVVVNGQLIARGDVVVIDDNFGVRITEIIGNNSFTEKK